MSKKKEYRSYKHLAPLGRSDVSILLRFQIESAFDGSQIIGISRSTTVGIPNVLIPLLPGLGISTFSSPAGDSRLPTVPL